MPDELPGDDDLKLPPSFFPVDGDEESAPPSLGEPVEVEIKGVFAAEHQGTITHYVLVSEGHRQLPIRIGPIEAHAISIALEHGRSDRPMTHDLLKSIIEKLDGDVDRVVIDDLWNGVYYAKVFLVRGEEEIAIDARPSDGIAIAVRFDVPVYVSEGILAAGDE